AEEQVVAAERRAVLEAKREGKPLPGEAAKPAAEAPTSPDAKSDAKTSAKAAPEAKPKAEPKTKPKTDGKAAPSADADKKAGALAALPKPPGTKPAAGKSAPPPTSPKPADAKPTAPTPSKPVAPVAEPEPEPIKLPLNPDTSWLEKGFFVSLAEKFEEGGKKWWRTARGGYLPANAAAPYAAKDHQGHELDVEADFPFGYAMAKSPQLVELTDDGKLKLVKKIDRRTFLDLSEETEVNGRAYMVTTEGLLIRKDHVRFAERQPIPEGIQPWERWIDVDITKQVLVAYEGDRPVFTTLVSSGRKGTKEEPFDTPTGRWQIRSKHVSTTMDGPTASDGNYSIQDVPWTMYFYESYALHGAFWHDSFGRVRSHGCVNIGPTDARWLFNWTTPFLPEGWHGVHAHEGSPGTTVVVRKSGK
ncbi:MAG: L,D-transpeptidase family protein, partial [Myxococcota bacterium]